MRKLPGKLDTGAGTYFLRKDQQTAFLKSQITPVNSAKRIPDPNDKPLHIGRFLKSFIHVGRLKKVLSFTVR